jgi:O-methyltransferase
MHPNIGLCRSLYLDLLKRSLSNTIYGDANISPGAASSNYSLELREAGRDWPAVAHTMIGIKRLDNLQDCVERVLSAKIPGDLIETGVWRGGASILMRGVLKAHQNSERAVWVADSFEGLPKPDPDRYPADAGDKHFAYAELAVSLEEVQENFRRYDLLDAQVRFVKGWFRDTLPALPAQQFAVIRLDGDMYESTMVALESLYPKLSPGGFAIIDDYGAIEGCRKAVDDFRDANSIFDSMHEVDWTGVYWAKDSAGRRVRDTSEGQSRGHIDATGFVDERGEIVTKGKVPIQRGLSGFIRGWIADVARGQPAARVLLQIDSEPRFRAEYGLERPDVATVLGNDAYYRSGFQAVFPTAHLEPGRHIVQVIGVASDGSRLSLTEEAREFTIVS